MVAPRALRSTVVAALRAAHPYEEPAFDVVELVPPDEPGTGLGRVGRLPAPMTLTGFVGYVAARLPATAAGVRAGGDPQRLISTVAVCGGAGDGELDAATAAGADVYVTSDLRHHVAAEHLADPGRPALVDVAHWAGEWPWLQRAADTITAELPGSVSVTVSQRCTDPWTVHRRRTGRGSTVGGHRVPPQADPFTQRKLLDLAATDRAADTAAHRRRSLPELAVIEGGSKQLPELRAAVVVAETEVSDLDREGRRLDTEIDQVRARSKRDRERLAAGSGTPRELEGLQHEIDSLDRRQGVLEDEALELMERRETADAALAASTQARQLVLDEVARPPSSAGTTPSPTSTPSSPGCGCNVPSRRAPMPPDLLALYERIRGTGRVAAAELVGNQCGACRVELDRVAFNAARAAPVDAVVRCENCGAILIRN